MRCFIAIDLPEHVSSKLFHISKIILDKNLINGNFIKRDSLHLTLKFLGEVDEEQLDSIVKRLRDIKFESFSCDFGKIGFFGENNNPKILWVEVISDSLLKLQQQISKKLLEFPEDFKNNKFTSHITLARIKSVINKDRLFEEINKLKLKKLEFKVNDFVLLKSELFTKESESKYKIIEKFPLK